MLKNERGSMLLVVLLMMLVFTVLGLSILSASIGGSKRTEIRETEIEDNLVAIKKLNESVAFIKATIEQHYDPDMSLSDYNDIIESMTKNTTYNTSDDTYKIKDISTETLSEGDLQTYFTRVLQVKSQNYKQKVYITGMPSFLKYALGSRGHLTLNGSVYVKEGNLYARDGLTISKTARYVYNEKHKEIDTSSPSVSNLDKTGNIKKSFLFLENPKIKYCPGSCYSGTTENNKFVNLNPLLSEDLKQVFNPQVPIYTQEKTEFIDVDILITFLEKLKEAGFYTNNIETKNLSDGELVNKIKNVITTGSVNSSVKRIDQITNKIDPENPLKIIDINNDSSIKGYLYQGTHALY